MEPDHRVMKSSKIRPVSYTHLDVYKRQIGRKLKLQIFKSDYVPTIIYGAETCTTLKKHANRITSGEMRFLKQLVEKT